MKYYIFQQNNSGGGDFVGAQSVLVLAENADEANEIAHWQHGVYFGVRPGDCTEGSCCGERWERAVTGRKNGWTQEFDTWEELEERHPRVVTTYTGPLRGISYSVHY